MSRGCVLGALRFSGEEMEVLSTFGFDVEKGKHVLSHEAAAMYVGILRPKMDFKTGLIGLPFSISLGRIAEDLTLQRGRSPKGSAKISVQVVRRLLSECVEVGLLERRKHPNPRGFKTVPLLFYARLAGCDLVCLEEVEHQWNASNQHCGEGSQHFENKGFSDVSRGDVQHGEKSEVERKSALSVGTSNTNKYIPRKFRSSGDCLPISKSWEPSVPVIDCIREEYGFSEEFLSLKSKEFWLFWRDRGDPRSDWDSQFYHHVKYHMNARSPEFVLAAQAAI